MFNSLHSTHSDQFIVEYSGQLDDDRILYTQTVWLCEMALRVLSPIECTRKSRDLNALSAKIPGALREKLSCEIRGLQEPLKAALEQRFHTHHPEEKNTYPVTRQLVPYHTNKSYVADDTGSFAHEHRTPSSSLVWLPSSLQSNVHHLLCSGLLYLFATITILKTMPPTFPYYAETLLKCNMHNSSVGNASNSGKLFLRTELFAHTNFILLRWLENTGLRTKCDVGSVWEQAKVLAYLSSITFHIEIGQILTHYYCTNTLDMRAVYVHLKDILDVPEELIKKIETVEDVLWLWVSTALRFPVSKKKKEMGRISCSSQISKTFSPVNLVETTKTLHAHLSDGILVRFILMLYYPSYFLDRWLPSSDQPSQHATWWTPNANQIDKLYSDTHPENKRNLVSNHKKFDVTSPQKSQLFSCNNWKVIFESFERIGVRSALTARDVCERFLSVRLRIFWLCSLVDLFEDVLERTTLGVIVATNRNEDKLSYLSAVLQELVTVRSKLESKIWDTSAYNQSVDEKVNKTSSDLQSSAIVNDAKADGSLYQDGSHCAVERNSCMEAHNGRSNENEQVNQLERSFATPLSTPHLVAEALMKHVKDSHPVIENKKDSGEMRDARVSICSQETRASSSITEPSLLSTQTFVPIQIDVGEKFKDADRFNVTHIPSFSCTKTTSPEGHVHRCEIKEDYTLQMDMKEEMNKQENPEKLDALLLHCDDTEEKESAIKKSILQVPEKLNSVERHDALLSLYEELKNDRFLNEGKHLHLLSDLLNHSLESVNSNVNDSHNVLSSSIHSTSLPNLKKYLNHKMTSHAHTSNSIDPVTLTQLLQSVENLKQNDIELESEKHSENVVHKLLRENFALRAQLVSVQRFHQNGTSSKVYRSNRYAPTPTHAVEGIPKEMASAENKIQDISEAIRDEKYLTPISSDTMAKKSSSGQENNVSQTLCCKKGYGEVTSPSIEKANKKYEYDAMDPICSKNQPSYLSGKSSARRNHKQDGSKMSNSPKLHADPKSNARKQVEMKEGTSVEQNPSIFDTSMTKMCTDDQASSSDASNIQRVRRVLVNVCLTGDSSRVQRNTVLGVLDGISEADITAQVLILLKSCESEKGTNDERTKYKFRGLYLYSPSKEHLRRCYGSGPLTVLTRAVSPHAGMLDSVMVQDLLCFDPQERNFIRIPEGNETANKKCVFYSADAFLVPES